MNSTLIATLRSRMSYLYQQSREGRLQAGRDLAYARFDELSLVLELLTGREEKLWREDFEGKR